MATKWGVVSAGKISHDFVTAVQSIEDAGQHEFVAVAARSLTSAQSFAETHNIPKAYGSYEELAKDSDIEVVYVGTVTAFHFEVGKLMLENGKHVLMEKPMTLNYKQTKSLIEIAKDKKCFLMEALWSRCTPSYKFMMEHIQKGSIGDVVHVGANLGINLPPHIDVLKMGVGGGTCLDIGIYTINIATMAFRGEMPIKVSGVGHLNDEGMDLSFSASLCYPNNGTASISASCIGSTPCDANIIGTKGSIKLPNMFPCPTSVVIADKTYSFPLPETIRVCNYPNSSGLRYEAMEVRECLNTGALESSIMPLKDSEKLAQIMDNIRQQIGVQFEVD